MCSSFYFHITSVICIHLSKILPTIMLILSLFQFPPDRSCGSDATLVSHDELADGCFDGQTHTVLPHAIGKESFHIHHSQYSRRPCIEDVRTSYFRLGQHRTSATRIPRTRRAWVAPSFPLPLTQCLHELRERECAISGSTASFLLAKSKISLSFRLLFLSSVFTVLCFFDPRHTSASLPVPAFIWVLQRP